jgi:GTP-binding protein Era
MSNEAFRCGFVAIAGRPNVGKSTLVNALVGHKISIVSPKPQTTRQRVLGLRNTESAQLVFVDTPGIHGGGKRMLNRSMNRSASSAIFDADVIVLVVEALRWTDQDERVLSQCLRAECPLGVVINKIDTLRGRTRLLPFIQSLQHKAKFEFIVPVSAERGENLAELERVLMEHLPESPPLFPHEQITDQPEIMRAGEMVREQLMRVLQQEVPYSTAVQIDEFKEERGLLRIAATIWVEREGQKAIVIGNNGLQLKKIGQEARMEMQRAFGKKVFLQLWVKVRENWADDERALRQLGLDDT